MTMTDEARARALYDQTNTGNPLLRERDLAMIAAAFAAIREECAKKAEKHWMFDLAQEIRTGHDGGKLSSR